MWRLIELADIVVQPGRQNDYNEYRLPSKLPDFLCIGKPLVTSTTNLGRKLEDGEEALLRLEELALGDRLREPVQAPERRRVHAQRPQAAASGVGRLSSRRTRGGRPSEREERGRASATSAREHAAVSGERE